MAIPTLPYGVRPRPGSPARHLPSPPSPFHAQTLARAEAAANEPYIGITTDGAPLTGLFSLQQTGVSTQPIKAAAEEYLAALSEGQRGLGVFPADDPNWQR